MNIQYASTNCRGVAYALGHVPNSGYGVYRHNKDGWKEVAGAMSLLKAEAIYKQKVK